MQMSNTHSIIHSTVAADLGVLQLSSTERQRLTKKVHFTAGVKKILHVPCILKCIVCKKNLKKEPPTKVSVEGKLIRSCGVDCALGGAPSLHQDKTTWWCFAAKPNTKAVMTELCM